eukprot:6186631-Pleurochrysis_carterae.AAC.5
MQMAQIKSRERGNDPLAKKCSNLEELRLGCNTIDFEDRLDKCICETSNLKMFCLFAQQNMCT